MKYYSSVFAISFLLIPGASLSQAYVPPSVSDFATPNNFKQPSLSADGSLIAYGTFDAKGEEIVKIVDVNQLSSSFVRLDKTFLDISHLGDTSKIPTEVSGILFDLKGNLIISQDKLYPYIKRAKYDEYGRFRQVIAADFKAKTSIQFTGVAYPNSFQYRKAKPNLTFTPSVFADWVYLSQFSNKTRDNLNVGEFEFPGGKFKQTGTANEDTVDWTYDVNGDPFTRLDFDRETKKTEIWQKRNGNWSKVITGTNNFRPAFELVGLSPKGAPLFVRVLQSEVGIIESIDPVTLEIKPFLDSKEFEIQSVLLDRWSGEAIGAKIGGAIGQDFYFEPDYKAIYEKLAPKFEGSYLSIIDLSLDKKRALISVSSDILPKAYYFYDVLKDKLLLIGNDNPALSKKGNSSVLVEEAISRDGTKIPVYVTLPPNAENSKNLPTVIMLPDYPESRTYPYFDFLPQFIASRGYLVLQPQLRGSIGFGSDFTRKGIENWDEIVQNDLEDTKQWAVKSGYMDNSKFCLLGRVFGGHNVMQAMVMRPETFKCGISHNGISDLGKWIASKHADFGFDSFNGTYWRALVSSWDSKKIQKLSPRRNADSINGNLLITFGVSSTEIEMEQSFEMAQSLKKSNKHYKYVEIPLGTSNLSNKSARETFLKELEVFLIENLGNPLAVK